MSSVLDTSRDAARDGPRVAETLALMLTGLGLAPERAVRRAREAVAELIGDGARS